MPPCPAPVPVEMVEALFVILSPPPQYVVSQDEEVCLEEIFNRSGDETLEDGSVEHVARVEASGPNMWYLPRGDWMPVWENNKVQ